MARYTDSLSSILESYTPQRIRKLAQGTVGVLLDRAANKALTPDGDEKADRKIGSILRAARDGIAIAQIAQQLERGEIAQPEEVESAVAKLNTLGDYQDYVNRVLMKNS